jgi:hypothetical protein
MPKKPLTAKEKKAEEEKKKQLAEELLLNPPPPKVETIEEALANAESWQERVTIFNKRAVGTLASSKYNEKVVTFSKVNKEEKSSILPLSSYYGPHPDSEKDKFDRRKV